MALQAEEDFDDLEEELLGNVDLPQAKEDDDEEMEIKPIQASQLSNNDLMMELERVGIKGTGFEAEDQRLLQAVYDSEHANYVEEQKKKRREAKARLLKQQRMQRKRLIQEQQLKEEHEEVEKDPRIKSWLGMIRQNLTNTSARVEVNSITARVLAQSLWDNSSLTCLDLSRNDLDDFAGLRLGRALKRNNALKKLELDTNRLGPKTCIAFGDSLKTNTTLSLLSMEHNPLTKEGSDLNGIEKLASMLEVNKTLTSLNLWRSTIGRHAGKTIADAMDKNRTLVFLDVGNNGLTTEDTRNIAAAMERNLTLSKQNQTATQEESERKAAADAETKAAEDVVLKKESLAKWMEDEKDRRAFERRKELEQNRLERERRMKEAEEEARKEKERKAAEEANSKKGKKGKKGKKK